MRSQLEGGSTIAGRYALGEVLGRGAMGEVRAGRDLRLDRDVAVKLLSAEVAVKQDSRDRFEAEARAAARLSHPNIVLVYDSGEHDGVPFLVMKRLRGEPWPTSWRGVAADRAGLSSRRRRAGGAGRRPPRRRRAPGHQARQRAALS